MTIITTIIIRARIREEEEAIEEGEIEVEEIEDSEAEAIGEAEVVEVVEMPMLKMIMRKIDQAPQQPKAMIEKEA